MATYGDRVGTPCGPRRDPWGPHVDPWRPHGDPWGGPWGPMGTPRGPTEGAWGPMGTHGGHGGVGAAGRVPSLLSPYGPLCKIIGGTDVNALGSAIADAMGNFNNSCNSTAQTKIWIPSFAQIAVAKGNLMTHESAGTPITNATYSYPLWDLIVRMRMATLLLQPLQHPDTNPTNV